MSRLSYQGMQQSILSTVPVNLGRIFSYAEEKLTSLIGMTILKNGLQFRFWEEEALRAMLIATRNISRDYKLTGKETVWDPFLDKCIDNYIKNKREKLLNGAEIYELHFQGDGATINDTPLLNNYLRGFTYLCQSERLCTVQVTSQVVTRRILHLLRRVYLIQSMTLIHRSNLWTYICSMEPVCSERLKTYWRLCNLCCYIFLEHSIPAIMSLKGWHLLSK